MESKEKLTIVLPPKVTRALAEGFNIAAEHLYLLVLPLLADLLIWLGPKLRIYELFGGYFGQTFAELTRNAPQELATQFDTLQKAAEAIIEHTNLMSMISSFPFSIPTLLGGVATLDGPVPNLKIIEIRSVFLVLCLFLLIGIIGFITGMFYLIIIAQASDAESKHITLRRFGRTTLNLTLFILAILGILLVLMLPFSCFFTILSLLSISLAQIVLLILFLGVAWLIIPMFYIFHGIFLSELNLKEALSLSFQMARWVSGPTSFFIVLSVIILQGLNLIWTIPAANSWLLLVGIIGNAFVTTALICASFVLYQQNLQWLSANAEIIKKGFIQK